VGDELVQNAILAALGDDELDRLRSMAEVVDLRVRDQVYGYRKPITEVYFPTTCVLSMVAVADDRLAVEIGTVGYEGMMGLPLFLGAVSSPTEAFCQVAGRAARMTADQLMAFFSGDGQLHSLLHRYTQTVMAQLSQNVACNTIHSTEQRAARWLLTTADRVRADEFHLTQEFLAQMLGVRRPTVSEIASKMQADGLITYTRGDLTILDRRRLTKIACSCYEILKAEFDAIPNVRSDP
jgi:CRP-like cAMP-binding protein